MNENIKYCDLNRCTYPCKECQKASKPMSEKVISTLLVTSSNELSKILDIFDLPVRMYENIRI